VPNSVNISGLTIANGNANNNGSSDGGGILSFDALTVSSSVLEHNQAPNGFGGAIYSGPDVNASLSVNNDVFTGNSVGSAAETVGFQLGGAIFNADGAIATSSSVLDLLADSLLRNEALGGSSPMGVQSAIGGAVDSQSGNPFAPNPISTISNSLFLGNEAIAGTGGGPSAITGGGALGYASTTPLSVSNTNFLGNQVVGSRGPNGGAGTEADGGGIRAEGSILTIQGGLIVGNNAVGGRGGDAQGSNGGDGGTGGDGGIASLQGSALTITGTTILGNSAEGGAGGRGSARGTGGNGLGGGIETDGTSVLDGTADILLGNSAIGGAGGGNAYGGGVYTLGSTMFTNSLVALNLAVGGTDGGQGVGGGVYIAGGSTILTATTQVVLNFATTSNDNIYGTSSTSPPVGQE